VAVVVRDSQNGNPSPMADHHLRIGKAVEDAGTDQAQGVRANLDGVTPRRAGHDGVGHILRDAGSRVARVQIQGHAQGLQGFPDRRELRLVDYFRSCAN
jgi:hypothetical protein